MASANSGLEALNNVLVLLPTVKGKTDRPVGTLNERESGMAQALSEIERKILDYMVSYLRQNTYQPSIREIGERFSIKSTKTVSEHLQALAEKGFLERDPSRSRGVKILGVDLAPEAVSIPCFQALPDDRAGLRSDRAEINLTIDRRLAGAKGSFFVRSRGDEAAVLGVQDGDYLLVEPLSLDAIADDAIVVARPGGGAPGYHRLTRNGRGVYLQSLRGGAPLLIEEPARLNLIGRVSALFRRLDTPGVPTNLTSH